MTSTATEDSSSDQTMQKKMIRRWLLIMLPCGFIMMYHTLSIVYSIIATFMPLLLAIAQGTVGILRYRICYGDAPVPVSPAHGVVVVSPTSKESSSLSETKKQRKHCCQHGSGGVQSVGCSCDVGTQWRIANNDQERSIVDKAKKELPLRLLCIGDSLAAGVGTSRSCTPILPEVIARSLSKAMGGRAVYWTCHGSPGASSGWIVRELESGTKDVEEEQPRSTKKLERSDSNCSDTDTDSIGSEESSEACISSTESSHIAGDDDQHEDSCEFSEWKRRLDRHKKRFDPNEPGGYDVAVVLTGPNDLKSAFFPFLLSGEAAEFYRQAQKRGGNFANELRRVVDVVADRMTLRLEKTLDCIQRTLPDNVLEQIEIHIPHVTTRSSATNNNTEGQNENDSAEHIEFVVDKFYKQQESADSSMPRHRRPIVVLPAMPADALPIFKVYPLRWLAVPIIKMMDSHKKSLAKAAPEEVVFVESPTPEAMAEFESQNGELWEQRESEDALLALRNVKKHTCSEKASAMKKYFGDQEDSVSCANQEKQSLIRKKSKSTSSGESQMFSLDGVHPNDEGYDFWGRHIANAIIAEWQKP